MQTVTLAFYKGDGNWYDRIVKRWTGEKYSHVEVAFARSVIGFSGMSSSPRDGGVRMKGIPIKPDHWDFIEVKSDFSAKQIETLFGRMAGRKYDWLSIWLTHVLPLGIGSTNRHPCTEACALLIGRPDLMNLNPGKLYRALTA